MNECSSLDDSYSVLAVEQGCLGIVTQCTSSGVIGQLTNTSYTPPHPRKLRRSGME